MESSHVDKLFLDMVGPLWSVDDIPTDTPLEKNWFFLSQQVSITNRFLVRGRTLCPLSCPSTRTLPGLNLCRCFACVTVCEFSMCVSPIVSRRFCFLSHPPCLVLRIFPPSLQHRSLSLEEKSLMKTFHLGLSAPKNLSGSVYPVMCLCVRSRLPQEASLTRDEWGTDLFYYYLPLAE